MDSILADLTKFQGDFGEGGLIRFVVALSISISFGLALSAIYRFYYRTNEPQDGSISRSMPIMSPAVTMIFWLIQFSLPLSLGLLGALSFVRFRTPVKRAEDIAFILILIAGSLACAIGHFLNAIILLALILIYSFARNNIGLISMEDRATAILTINSEKKIQADTINKKLKAKCDATLVSQSTRDGIGSFVFNLNNLAKANSDDVVNVISEFDSNARVDLFFPENQLGA
ncbi:MAG: DUF4956 domain-containing protein [Cyanobacteria bacterium]|nr:DUF4956 domain-containing protein [Cyanobacteriota bacterium]MDA1020256.1 DUF4956 domain-containing protein [Cyanobacteriota bacterium]